MPFIQNYKLLLLLLTQSLFKSNRMQLVSVNNTKNSCKMGFSGDFSKDWVDQINKFAEKNVCEAIDLELLNCKFPSKILHTDWLEGINVKVTTLKLTSCNCETIAPEALAIKGLQNLHFHRAEISYFEKNFLHCSELSTFIVDYAPENFKVESCLFENAQRVETLQIEKSIFSGELISNITGVNGCSTQLQNIVIRYNTIKSLPDFIVRKAMDLRSLSIYQNGLENISQKAFWGPAIQLIDLHGNDLTTLEEGTFNDVLENKWVVPKVDLNGNNWRCDCDLKWLQDLYCYEEKITFEPDPKCDTSKSFADEVFCPDTSTTTTTTETPTSPEPKPNKTVICKEGSFADTSITREFFKTIEITISQEDNNLVKVDIYNLDDDPQLELVFSSILQQIHLIYFDILNSEDPSCISNIQNQKSILLGDLTRNHTYTMCLIEDQELTVPPTNCFGVQIPPDWDERSWITNEHKTLIISCAAVSLILCTALSFLIAYYVIRTHPTLISGNKDVIILKHGPKVSAVPPTTEAMHFERPVYAEPTHSPSCYHENVSGYLTPATRNYEKINYYTRHTNSIYDGRSSSYIRPGFSGNSGREEIDEKVESYSYSGPPIPKLDKMKDKIYY